VRVLYHGTPSENVDRIRREGLRRGAEPVHLSYDPFDAGMIARVAHDVDDVTVLVVDTVGLTLAAGYDGPGTYTVVEDLVGPERISEWTPGKG
jgi:RNA:NAD 2'-phosphotransferase (TPT1/KptA family)